MTTRQAIDTPAGQIQALRSSVNQLAARTVHYDTDETLAATLEALNSGALASNEATLVILANGLKTAWNSHLAATTTHAAADSTNTVSAATATDTASATTTVNELKADFNAHAPSLTYHRNPAAVFVDTADGSNEATAITLANRLRAVVLDHLRNGMQTLPETTLPGAV